MSVIRGVLFLVALFVTTPIVHVFVAPIAIAAPSRARPIARVWCRLVLAQLRILCGVRAEMEGEAPLPSRAALVAANHQSMWETIYLYAHLPHPVVVVKKELLALPIFGWWLKKTGCIIIDRTAGPRAIRDMTKAARAAHDADAQIVIFPEGTRVSVGDTRPLQPGVAALYAAGDCPCTPVIHDSGRYWINPGPEKRPGVIRIRILPEIPAGLNRKVFLKRLEEEMRANRFDLSQTPTPPTTTPVSTSAAPREEARQ